MENFKIQCKRGELFLGVFFLTFILTAGFKSEISKKSKTQYATITNVAAVRNYAQLLIDGKEYDLLYGDHLNVLCNESNGRKTIYLLDVSNGTFSRKRYVFMGYKYSIWIDNNGNWEISQQA